MAGLAQTVDGLSELILELDPARTTWERFVERARGPTEELSRQVQRLRRDLEARVASEGEGSTAARLDDALDRAAQTLADLRHSLSGQVDPTRWRQLYTRLAQSYDDLRRLLDTLPQPVPAAAAPRLSRMNLTRAVFHAGMGLFAALLYHFALARPEAIVTMAITVTVFVGLELGRRRSSKMNDFLMANPIVKVVARPHEYFRVNSSTYFAIGLLLAAILCPKPPVELACVVLAIADPVASTLGRRFGRTKLYRDKSFVGTAAFFVAGALASFVYLTLLYPELDRRWLIATVVAAAGAVTELLTTRLDDNLTIPLLGAIAASFVI